jgi:hypothetical protein
LQPEKELLLHNYSSLPMRFPGCDAIGSGEGRVHCGLHVTRAQVLRQIVESGEVSAKYNHQEIAVMEYFGYLRRQPDAFYLDWIAALDANNDPRGMVIGFATSQEYRSRFGP